MLFFLLLFWFYCWAVSILLILILKMTRPCSQILQSCAMNRLLSPVHSSKQPPRLLLASPSTIGPVKSRGTYLHGSGDPERDFLYSESWNKLATVFLPFGNRPEWHTPVRRMWLPNPPRPGDHEVLSWVYHKYLLYGAVKALGSYLHFLGCFICTVFTRIQQHSTWSFNFSRPCVHRLLCP